MFARSAIVHLLSATVLLAGIVIQAAPDDEVAVELRLLSLPDSLFERACQEFGLGPKPHVNYLDASRLAELLDLARAVDPLLVPMPAVRSGRTTTVDLTEQHPFVTSVRMTCEDGQVVTRTQSEPTTLGLTLTVRPVLVADPDDVTVKLRMSWTRLESSIPLTPVTALASVRREAGGDGEAIPLTEYLERPALFVVDLHTKLRVPPRLTGVVTGWRRKPETPAFVKRDAPRLGRLLQCADGGDGENVVLLVTPHVLRGAGDRPRLAKPQAAID
jgi:hypothetical protein